MITVVIRLLGLIALFWVNVYVSILGIVALGFVRGEDWHLKGGIKSDKARFFVECATSAMAIVGIWFFPKIPENYAHITAIVAAVVTIVLILSPVVKERTS